VACVPTGVKHLHHKAESFDVGVYFEANGHGTVLFSPATQSILASHAPANDTQRTALRHLVNITEVINQTVGDALSDMLLVEAVLAHKSYGSKEWDALYADLPNRLVKVVVADRNAFTTTDAERKLLTPQGLQGKVDALIAKYASGRSFVRPSGTEDVVRVYAEAETREQADGESSNLAIRVLCGDQRLQNSHSKSRGWSTTKLEAIPLSDPRNFCNLNRSRGSLSLCQCCKGRTTSNECILTCLLSSCTRALGN
jgi:phosphomannomutase